MLRRLKRQPALLLGIGLAAGLLVGVGMFVGALAAGAYYSQRQFGPPEMLLHATSTHGTDSFAMATGWIDEEGEGVFFLDYLTGELQCWVLYPRTGNFRAKFVTNVARDLGVERGKKPRYLMVTGQSQFLRGGGVMRPANSVVYVADANTGNFAAYTLAWDRTAAAQFRPQQGALLLLDSGRTRLLEIRE